MGKKFFTKSGIEYEDMGDIELTPELDEQIQKMTDQSEKDIAEGKRKSTKKKD